MKLLNALPLALLVSAMAAVPAQADPNDNGFIGVKAGTAYWSLDDNYSDTETAFSYGLQGGYRWGINENNSIGIEAGYIDFGSISDSTPTISADLEGHAITLGANYQLLFGGDHTWYFEARTGYLQWSGEVSGTVHSSYFGDVSASESDDGNGWYAGAGVGRFFTPHFGVSLNYDFHSADVLDQTMNAAVFTVGAEYRF